LSDERRVSDDVVRGALQYLSKEEFDEVVSGWDKLKALGLLGGRC